MVEHETKSFKWLKVATTATCRRGARLFGVLLRPLVVLPVLVYQYLVAPLIADCCRFHPSCSTYVREAISRHGAVRGGWLSIKRLVRCHPWGGSGCDPVP